LRRLIPVAFLSCLLAPLAASAAPPLYISHHWHMHQPIYWPYESVVDTENRGAYSFSLWDVFQQRGGPYGDWPANAIESGMNWGFDHIGAQVSLSGSLIENLDDLEGAGWGFGGWKGRWQQAAGWDTSLGNPRLDIVAFGYHHPLMGLIDSQSLQLQVELHAEQVQRAFGTSPGRGMFPPECAFTPRMIPALKAAGVEWIMVDSIHLERAHRDYPWSSGSNLVPPNGADVWNDADTDWVTLQNLWAPSPVAAPWAYRPHWSVYIDPETGEEHRIVVVPAARYEGNEDARGGYGALLYDPVFRSYVDQNDDDDHPMLALLAHDGDNYGAGSDSYYHANWDGYLSWLAGNAGTFAGTTVQDYLDQFPPDPDDTLHVEDGAWSGADNGDAEFAKWNGDPGEDGYSPDRNSWAVMTAAQNHVHHAQSILPNTSAAAVLDDSGSDTDSAWRWFLVAQTSCYWYWDGSEGGIWDSHPTRAANEAMEAAGRVIANGCGDDMVGPSIYLPQREPYNPGGYEWGDTPLPSEFQVWTYVYDTSSLDSVVLKVRVDDDGCRDVTNEVYGSGGWQDVEMEVFGVQPTTDPLPLAIADGYAATVDAGSGVMVDYYVEATDLRGNVSRSPIMHVVVGTVGGAGGDLWEPEEPTAADEITVFSDEPGALHWGVNGWDTPAEAYWPAGTVDWGDGQAVETPLDGPDGDGRYSAVIGPFDDPGHPVSQVDFVFHFADDSWSSPDQVIPIDAAVRDDECVPYFRSGGYDGDPFGDDDDDDDDDGDDDDDTADDDDDDAIGDDDSHEPVDGFNTCSCRQDGRRPASAALAALALIGRALRRRLS